MLWTAHRYIFDLKPDDTFFCTADCGWITGESSGPRTLLRPLATPRPLLTTDRLSLPSGHSYVAYGPLLNRGTQLVFEGVPSHPDAGRLWRMVDK